MRWGAFAAGLVFGWLYEKTGSLTVPVVAHYLLNSVPFLAALAAPSG